MATNYSPWEGSSVLNQFPSIVMFDMKGFQVSASGAIQGHHGPLVDRYELFLAPLKGELLGSQCLSCGVDNSLNIISITTGPYSWLNL